MIPILFGKVIKGQLLKIQPERWIKHLSSLEGQQVTVKIDKERHPRTNAMNRYYWGAIVEPISEYTGIRPGTLHEHHLKKMFASHPETIWDKQGNPVAEVIVTEHTSQMTIERFKKYCEDCKQWAAEFLGIYIGDPGEYA